METRLSGLAAAAFSKPLYLKFAATVDELGTPNVVPLLSARMTDPETVAFVRFMVWKTARNLESTRKVTFSCRGPKKRAFLVKGEFVEWVKEGPLLEEFENEPIYRYNAYAGANELGLVKVKEVLEYPAEGMLRTFILGPLYHLLPDFLRKNPGNGSGPMPPQTIDKFKRPLAAKFAAFVDKQGDPVAFPLFSMRPLSADRLLLPLPREKDHPLRRLDTGRKAAAAVLTHEPSAYQVKGTIAEVEKIRGRNHAVLEVKEVFTAAPPVPGRRVHPPDIPSPDP